MSNTSCYDITGLRKMELACMFVPSVWKNPPDLAAFLFSKRAFTHPSGHVKVTVIVYNYIFSRQQEQRLLYALNIVSFRKLFLCVCFHNYYQ